MTRASLAGATIAVAALWTAPAFADDTTHDKAVAAFQEGRRWVEAGNCDAAVSKFRESIDYEPSVGARLSLAECVEKTDPLQAWRLSKDAAHLAFVNHDDRFALAQQRASDLEKRLPTLRVNVPARIADEPGFVFRVDGEVIDPFVFKEGVVAVKPGAHVVEASAPLRHFATQVSADAGTAAQVDVRLEQDVCKDKPATVVAPVEAPPVHEYGMSSGRRTLVFGLAGLGIGGLLGGAAFGVAAINSSSTLDGLCRGDKDHCNPASEEAKAAVATERNNGKTMATLSDVSFIVGGAALIGAVTLWATAPSGAPSTRAASRSARANVRVAPMVGTTQAGAFMTGEW